MTRLSKSRTTFLSAAAILVASTSLFGQTPKSSYSGHYVVPAPIYHRPHASTVFESYSRGIADRIDAAGRYNFNTGLGRVHNEEARSRYLMNKKVKADVYFGKKKVREEYFKAQAQTKAERRERNLPLLEQRTAMNLRLYRLGSTEFDPSTGEIVWPVAIKREKYRDLRTQVEQLFREHARHRTAGLVNEIERETSRLGHNVRRDVADFEMADYHIAQKFLIGLKCEAKFPVSNLSFDPNLVTSPPSHGSAFLLR